MVVMVAVVRIREEEKEAEAEAEATRGSVGAVSGRFRKDFGGRQTKR